MKIQRALLLIMTVCLAAGPAFAELSKQNRSRGKSGSVRIQRMASSPAVAPPVTPPDSVQGGNQTLYVAEPPTGNNATGDGSLAAPYATIQFAFLSAVSGDEIRVLPGTYNECVNNTAFALGVQKNLTVVADEFLNTGSRTATIIDGTGQCVFPFSVVNLAGSGLGSRVEGFTITGGVASGVFVLGSGVVTNNVITNNTSLDGAGVYAYPGTCFYGTGNIEVSDNTINNNTADDEGTCSVGGIPCASDTDCQPSNGVCDFLGGDGGGVFVRAEAVNSGGTSGCVGGDAIVTVENNVIDSNGADRAFGGGMYVLTNTQSGRAASVTVTQNLISNNTALPFSVGYGGGAWLGTYGYGTETIDFLNNTVTGNLSTGDGGGISAWVDALTDADHTINLTANDVQLNAAEGGGGGMDLFVFSLDVQNASDQAQLNASGNLILSNAAQGTGFGLYPGVGGGVVSNIWSQRSSAVIELNVRENDVRGNTATVAGGGIAAIATADADPADDPAQLGPALSVSNIRNNLIAANTATDGVGANSAVGGGIFAYAEGLGGLDASNPSISMIELGFNTVAQNTADVGSGGIEIESFTTVDTAGNDGSAVVDVTHSIIYDNTGFGVGGPTPPGGGVIAPAGGTGTVSVPLTYNSIFMNAGGGVEGWLTTGVGSLFTDPQLDASFVPSRCSDTIDAGNPLISAAGEPFPNGPPGGAGLVNLGHTGGIAAAVTTLSDASGDSYVDGIDLLRISVAFGTDPSVNRWDPLLDFDRDLFISGIDLALLAADFGTSCP